eukprot:5935911-Amphidinium_carterae.2
MKILQTLCPHRLCACFRKSAVRAHVVQVAGAYSAALCSTDLQCHSLARVLLSTSCEEATGCAGSNPNVHTETESKQTGPQPAMRPGYAHPTLAKRYNPGITHQRCLSDVSVLGMSWFLCHLWSANT